MQNDELIYEITYKGLNLKNLFINDSFEIGYKISNLLFNKYLVYNQFKIIYFGICTLLIYRGLSFFYKKKKICYIFLLLMLDTDFYIHYFIVIRQAMAISIFIFSLKYLYKKEFWKYSALIFIACLFHKSAIILIALYPFINVIENIDIKKYIKIYLGIRLFAFFYPLLINVAVSILKYQNYISVEKVNRYLSKSEVIYKIFSLKTDTMQIAVIIWLLLLSNKKITPKLNFLLKGFLFYFMICYMKYSFAETYRFQIYLLIFNTLIIFEILQSIKNREIKEYFKIGVTLIYSIHFIYIVNYYYINSRSYVPYINYVFDKTEDIDKEKTVAYKRKQNSSVYKNLEEQFKNK